jgi:geranylgeranyl pyrophosphate synthase
MNDPLTLQPLTSEISGSPLLDLLEQHFSPAALAELLGPESGALGPQLWSAALAAPLASFLERPGKAFRADLVSSCFELAGGRGPCPPRLCAIVEVLHAGSLIIDDIEDGSSSRRGGPALHRSHGLPLALNAGSWMYFWALGLIEQMGTSPALELALHRWSHRTLLRCHHGQALDLTANVYQLQQSEVAAVVRAAAELKTGALMELAAALGALAAGAAPELVDEFGRFGRAMGVGLQMLDDVGGIVSERRCHKGHEDLSLGRPTWPWAWLSVELAPPRFEELRRQGREIGQRQLHPEVVARRVRELLRGSGRVRVRRHLQQVFAQLESAVGPQPALEDLRAQLQRMEKSYA